jgi:hypothetical protein
VAVPNIVLNQFWTIVHHCSCEVNCVMVPEGGVSTMGAETKSLFNYNLGW